MAGMFSAKSIDLVRPYFEKFYDELPFVYKNHSRKYLETYMFSLLPRLEVKDSHIVKLVSLKKQTPDNESMFANMLNEGVDLLLRTKEIRDFAKL